MSNSEQTTKAKQTAEKPKLTPEQREAQRKQALDDAAKKAVSSVTNLRAYLAVQSRFERYSANNNLLIFAQRPDATRLKSLELWNKEKKWIREGAKAVAIYEPVRKQGKDGKTYTNFVRKNMFDISDIKDPEPNVQPTYTAAEAVQGLFAHKAVDVRMIPDYPSDRQFGAFYDAEENCVYAKRGMGYEQIFTDVAVALAHAEMAKDIEGYLPAEHQFEARCAAYVLAKKYPLYAYEDIFTHFTRREDATMNMGKFEEELKRMEQILRGAKKNTLILLNESFATTTEVTAYQIAMDLMHTCLSEAVTVWMVTHITKFAKELYGEHPENVLFLSAGRTEENEIRFQMYEKVPGDTSYGLTLYEQMIGKIN